MQKPCEQLKGFVLFDFFKKNEISSCISSSSFVMTCFACFLFCFLIFLCERHHFESRSSSFFVATLLTSVEPVSLRLTAHT